MRKKGSLFFAANNYQCTARFSRWRWPVSIARLEAEVIEGEGTCPGGLQLE
jgi:hypothetical protein